MERLIRVKLQELFPDIPNAILYLYSDRAAYLFQNNRTDEYTAMIEDGESKYVLSIYKNGEIKKTLYKVRG